MKFEDLVRETGEEPRILRWLRSQELLPPPYGGRANATYGQEHVDAVRKYQFLRGIGLPPSAVRAITETHLIVTPFAGVTVLLKADQYGERDAARVSKAVGRALSTQKDATTTESQTSDPAAAPADLNNAPPPEGSLTDACPCPSP